MTTPQTWHESAAQLQIESRAYINGKYCPSLKGETFDCFSARDGKLLAQVARCDAQDLDVAVSAARQSFDAGVWADMPVQQRKAVLFKAAALLEADENDFALLESLDMGKPVRDALAIDVPRSVECLQWYAEAIDKVYGEISPTSDQQGLGMITREAIGVVAVIVPWNYPLLMALTKLAPALAVGNSIVVKPSERSPLTALRLAAVLSEAGVPPGVVNILPGFGHDLGEAIGLHPDIDCLAFTGSTATGKRLLEYSGRSNMKRVYSECGGKSASVVFADCGDIDAVAQASARAIFSNQGEVCVAASRLLLDEKIYESFLERLVHYAGQQQPNDPLEHDSFMGPLVDEQHLQRVHNYCQEAVAAGAVLACGGERLTMELAGSYFPPTIFTQVSPDMALFQQEVFGPVLAITTFANEDEAVRLANDSCYGLAAGVWTQNLSRAHRVARKLKAGTVWVNGWSRGGIAMPFGGFKESGNGRDRSLHALEKFTEIKSTWISL